MIAEVIVDIATSETDRIYDYLCSDELTVGSRVLAPFGGKTVSGFIVNLKEESNLSPERLKKVVPFSDGLPAINLECLMLKLALHSKSPKGRSMSRLAFLEKPVFLKKKIGLT